MKQFRRARDIAKMTLCGLDGQVGTIQELHFDDQTWTVRHLVVRTGGWLMGREVLIAPVAIGEIDDASMRINLQKEQIEHAPSIESTKLISRQYEEAYYMHFLWPLYWQPDTTLWGSPLFYPDASTMSLDEPLLSDPSEQLHLSSSEAVTGYGIRAQDGEIGHLEDLVIDDEDWIIRYLEVDTRKWLPGKKVLVQTGRIQQIDWHSRSVTMSLTRDALESAPAYDPSKLITPDYELQLFKHYGKGCDVVTNAESRC
jgi:sporulation protein YlmC with PRC-barrel domain